MQLHLWHKRVFTHPKFYFIFSITCQLHTLPLHVILHFFFMCSILLKFCVEVLVQAASAGNHAYFTNLITKFYLICYSTK